MKPNFESPVRNAKDLVERNITLYDGPNGHMWKQLLSQSDILEYRKIAETMIITKSRDHFEEMTKNEMLSQGTHAQMRSYIYPDQLAWGTEYDHGKEKYKYNRGRGYYKGEKLSGIIPTGGYLTNKKWHLNEVDNKTKIFITKTNVFRTYCFILLSRTSSSNISLH